MDKDYVIKEFKEIAHSFIMNWEGASFPGEEDESQRNEIGNRIVSQFKFILEEIKQTKLKEEIQVEPNGVTKRTVYTITDNQNFDHEIDAIKHQTSLQFKEKLSEFIQDIYQDDEGRVEDTMVDEMSAIFDLIFNERKKLYLIFKDYSVCMSISE
jgi:hypothetical protein